MKQTRKFEFELDYNKHLFRNGQTILDMVQELRDIDALLSPHHTVESIECRREQGKPLCIVIEVEELDS